jgi:hypothetical protein
MSKELATICIMERVKFKRSSVELDKRLWDISSLSFIFIHYILKDEFISVIIALELVNN